MKFPAFIFLLVAIMASSISCKRCYQCAVRKKADESIAYYYKEVCVNKKDYKAYKQICQDALADSTATGEAAGDSLYCNCEHNLELE